MVFPSRTLPRKKCTGARERESTKRRLWEVNGGKARRESGTVDTSTLPYRSATSCRRRTCKVFLCGAVRLPGPQLPHSRRGKVRGRVRGGRPSKSADQQGRVAYVPASRYELHAARKVPLRTQPCVVPHY